MINHLLFSCNILLLLLFRCDRLTFQYEKQNWTFPITVRQAAEKYGFNYQPPGYYYKIENGTEVMLDYHSEGGDFYNERQPKETLYPRAVHSYIFRFPEYPNTYDSLKNAVEKQFGKPFVLTKGTKDSEYASVKEFEYNLLKVDQCLTIGIKRSKEHRTSQPVVSLRFMYNLPLGRIGVHMGNF